MAAKIETPQEFKDKVDEYFAKPNFITHYYKNEVYEIPEITSEAVARYMGYHPKYIYQIPTSRHVEDEDEWQEAIDYLKGRLISYYKIVSEHGNQTFGMYMLACLGEKPDAEAPTDNAIQIQIVDAKKPDED